MKSGKKAPMVVKKIAVKTKTGVIYQKRHVLANQGKTPDARPAHTHGWGLVKKVSKATFKAAVVTGGFRPWNIGKLAPARKQAAVPSGVGVPQQKRKITMPKGAGPVKQGIYRAIHWAVR